MKGFTDLPQSKKLAKFLPIESADMWYHGHSSPWESEREYDSDACPFHSMRPNWDIPCWSLAALFGLLPNCVEGAEPSLIKTFRNDYRIVYDIDGDENITSEDYTNPIDACYEMILRLNEKNLL